MTSMTSMNRNDVTKLIISTRRNKQLSWSSIAAQLNASPEWARAACQGQMPLATQQAETLTALLGYRPGAALLLQEPPHRVQPRCLGAHPMAGRSGSGAGGYIEDRRPNANVDPYVVSRLIVDTCATTLGNSWTHLNRPSETGYPAPSEISSASHG
jgi:hypothetical protein